MQQAALEFDIGHAAIQGARAYQQDFCTFWRETETEPKVPGAAEPLLAVLSDGMGGHVAGEVASRIACERYVEVFSSSGKEITKRLDHSLDESNDALAREITKNPQLDGMGCTLLAAYLDQSGLRWMSVGDSALMYYRKGELFRLNEDHSLGSILDRQAAANIITEQEAKSSPQRRSLRSALIGKQIALRNLQEKSVQLRSGDLIILASDGLETLQGDEIAAIIRGYDSRGGAPSDIAKALLDAVEAKRVPNQDNTTVMIVRARNPLDPSVMPTKLVERPKKAEDDLEPTIEPKERTTVPVAAMEPPAAPVQPLRDSPTSEGGRGLSLSTLVLTAIAAAVLAVGAFVVVDMLTGPGDRGSTSPSETAVTKEVPAVAADAPSDHHP